MGGPKQLSSTAFSDQAVLGVPVLALPSCLAYEDRVLLEKTEKYIGATENLFCGGNGNICSGFFFRHGHFFMRRIRVGDRRSLGKILTLSGGVPAAYPQEEAISHLSKKN